MYIIKNAYLSIVRGKGRNILIGIIITAIIISACIALSIKQSSDALINTYKNNNPVEISFNMNPMSFRESTDEEKEQYSALTIDQIKNYGNSTYVSDYYYMMETSVSGTDLTAVSYTKSSGNQDMPNMGGNMENIGDFRLTAYSNAAYIEDFINGVRKIIEGTMIESDNTDKLVVISEELALENNLSVGDTIELYLPNDEEVKETFTISGIFSDENEIESNNFMPMNAMNTRNQIYTNITNIEKFVNVENEENTNTENRGMMRNNQGLTAKFYLTSSKDIQAYEKEVRNKGLSNFYQITTNEDAVTATLEPIKNLSNFSISFLIIILIVGAVVIGIINMINIRERKYEIGVLRAIGMNKIKVTIQMVIEIFLVSLVSLIIGIIIGITSAQPVTNIMLKNEISSMNEKSTNIQNNFGPGNFERPSINGGNRGDRNKQMPNIRGNINYVDSLKVKINFKTILNLIIVSISLTIVSGIISVLSINKYEPNKILQNRA